MVNGSLEIESEKRVRRRIFNSLLILPQQVLTKSGKAPAFQLIKIDIFLYKLDKGEDHNFFSDIGYGAIFIIESGTGEIATDPHLDFALPRDKNQIFPYFKSSIFLKKQFETL